jgi:NitT/TauT family transport system substrate-binding protein
MNRLSRIASLCLAIAFAIVCLVPSSSSCAEKAKKHKVLWSIYAGWQPWDYADQSGIIKKWADKYGIQITLDRMDYVPSIEALVAKKADACVMTNMEALDMPAASGIGVTSIIMGDFSNGNDDGLSRDNLTIEQWKGQKIYLVEFSVSHYILSRMLEKHGLTEADVTIVNTSDSDIGPAFIANKEQKCVVTWNPIVMQIMQQPGISKTFSSAEIPGEILDLMVVRNEVMTSCPDLAKALTGAWYETMAIMTTRGPTAEKALGVMAASAGCTVIEYKQQLKTTAMFYAAKEGADYTAGMEIKANMDRVRKFCFAHKLLGENAKSADKVGIKYPDGTVQGNPGNVKFIFDATYMKMAADGKL